MPIAEPTVLDLRQYSLRLVGSKATVWPDTPGQQFTVLGRSDLVARPLPQANVPNSPDFVQGSWTGRLFDAGEGSLVFPNKEASDGVPWRMRFDPTGKLQWVEVYLDGYLESVLCVTKVTNARDSVTVEGYDGIQLTKSAYVRDWTCVQAPRDVIERGTQLWMLTTVDNFPYAGVATPSAQWTVGVVGSGSVSILAGGGLFVTVAAGSSSASVASAAIPVATSGAWSSETTITTPELLVLGTAPALTVTESTGDAYAVAIEQGATSLVGTIKVSGATKATVVVPLLNSYALQIESDGEWVSAYVNGQLIGAVRRLHASSTTIKTTLGITTTPYLGGFSEFATFAYVLTRVRQPFLQRGSDKGDYVLPGDATTYPVGGLHARYSNNLDLQSDADRLAKIHSPPRTQAYGGSGTPGEYANQQDSQISAQNNPTPGAALSGWSCVWFGAIYLKLSAGNYTLQLNFPAVNTVARVWVGKTGFGDQLLDVWSYANHGTQAFTVTAANLAGTLGYAGGTVQRDGWYPIKVEYSVDATAGTAPQFLITNSPAAYTDPGGTAIASGAQSTVVPATSLSPLGMVDQRFQGTSHYDLIQKTALAYGYQYSLEPQQLESGLFPGVVAPRIREGADYDTLLEPDDTQRKDGLLNYSALEDGTDQISSVIGNGAGFQNGTTGQLQAEVFDAATLQASLYDMQGWQDFADASFPSLLEALLQSQLDLRLVPWEVVSGDPMGRERKAFTWPLPGAVANMRWRPGDGARIFARDINVQDTSPRQMLEVARSILPTGVASTQAHFASRPKSNVYANRQALSAALRPQRNYQRQLVALTGTISEPTLAALATDPGSSAVALSAGDQIVKARLRVFANSGSVSFDVLVNGVDETAVLLGPWTTLPLNLDFGAVAVVAASNQLLVQIKNASAVTTSTFAYQIFVDVLR